MLFPLPFVPKFSYKTGGRRFGAPRHNGRKHAGCDLIAPLDTPIFAVADGIVMLAGGHEFYRGTFAVIVQHHHFTVRYCEVRAPAPGIHRGLRVKAGTVIAYVGKMFVDSMLHFEVYSKPYGIGGLTDRKNKPYQRRSDLIDPTSLLDRLRRHVQNAPDPIAPSV